MKKQLVWEPWKDPLSNQLGLNAINKDSLSNIDQESQLVDIQEHQMIQTPFGFTPIKDGILLTSDFFDFWILHTNFSITIDILEVISNIDGVESLEPLTPYRMRIGFPKSGLFNIKSIRLKIEQTIRDLDISINLYNDNIIKQLFNENICKTISKVRDNLYANSKHWLIYILPNGKTEIINSNEENKRFLQQLAICKTSLQLIGGHILSSNDYNKNIVV